MKKAMTSNNSHLTAISRKEMPVPTCWLIKNGKVLTQPGDLKVLDFGSGKCGAVNPVTWDLSKTADRNRHKGFLFNNNTLYSKSFTTHLIDGAIWISTPHFPYRSMAWTMDDYHIGDVNLFWEDVRHNAKLRANEFIKAGDARFDIASNGNTT